MLLQGHIGDISDLAFAPDGHRLASVSQSPRRGNVAHHDGTVRLWEIGSQGAASVLRGHKLYVYPVAYSPDGQWIASGDWDNKVFLWDALTMEYVASLPHSGNIRSLAFSPDSSWLVVGCAMDDSLFIWNVTTARRRNKLKGPGGIAVQAIAVSPDGAHIAAADADGPVSIMEAATGAVVDSFRMVGNDFAKKSLAYSPDGRLLAGTGEDGTEIDIRDMQTRRRIARLAGHTDMVSSVSFSGDGRLLASASADRTVRIWDVAKSKWSPAWTGTPTRSSRRCSIRTASGWRQPAAIVPSGCGIWRRARRWRVSRDTRTTCSHWLSARTERAWRPAPATALSGYGTPSRRRCDIRPDAKPRLCCPRRSNWLHAFLPSCMSRTMLLAVCGPISS